MPPGLLFKGSNQQNCAFAHDALGRMIHNGMTGQQIAYNDLDLVRNIESNGTTLVNYFYLADGTKLSADSSLTLESAGYSGVRLTGTSVMAHVSTIRSCTDGLLRTRFQRSTTASAHTPSAITTR